MTTVLIAHPSADVYGSDLQLLETVTAFRDAGHQVTVVLPSPGPLVDLLDLRGASVQFLAFPILRKNLLSPRGLLNLAADTLASAPRIWRTIRDAPNLHAVWINTITMPSWFLLSRLAGKRTLTHVHEAENDGPRWALWGLAAPTVLAHRIVTNSAAAAESLTEIFPFLRRKISVVHNGMSGPEVPPLPPKSRAPRDPATVALIGRLSPRKGIDVAMDAVALLRGAGRQVQLSICGTVFAGYEWYEAELRERAQAADLAGAIEFQGYVNPTWPVLADADVAIVPSRVEPFGNTAVEALLAQRPLVVSATQGLKEIVEHERTGLLVRPDDPQALASAIERLLDDPDWAASLAEFGRTEAMRRFSPDAYSAALLRVLDS